MLAHKLNGISHCSSEKSLVIFMSLAHLAACVSVIALELLLLHFGLASELAGLWTGIFFGISGIFGIVSSMKSSVKLTAIFFFTSVLSLVMCLPLVILKYRHLKNHSDDMWTTSSQFVFNIIQLFFAVFMVLCSFSTAAIAFDDIRTSIRLKRKEQFTIADDPPPRYEDVCGIVVVVNESSK